MPKFFCDYCDVYLTHDSMSVRKAHNSGRNHLRNVQDYYQQIGHEQMQSVIDTITNSYIAEGQAVPQGLQQPRAGSGAPPFSFPGMPGMPFPGMSGPPGMSAPSGMSGPPGMQGPPGMPGMPGLAGMPIPPGMPVPPGMPGFMAPPFSGGPPSGFGQAGSPQNGMPFMPPPGMGRPGMPNMPPSFAFQGQNHGGGRPNGSPGQP